MLKGRAREIVLTAVLVVALFYLFKPSAGPPGPAGEDAVAAGKDRVMSLVRALERLGTLDHQTISEADLESLGRNLFDYGKPPPPPGPSAEELARLEAERLARLEEERRRREEAERLRQEMLEKQRQEALRAAQEQRDAAPPPPSPAKPVPPSLNLKYIGAVGEQNDRIAIFLDGEQFVMAREGEVVKEDFLIQKISYDTLQMGYVDPVFAGEHKVLPMGE